MQETVNIFVITWKDAICWWKVRCGWNRLNIL